jgi:hypothetical protein
VSHSISFTGKLVLRSSVEQFCSQNINTEPVEHVIMSSDSEKNKFLDHAVGIMVASLKFRRAFNNALEDAGMSTKHLMVGELEKEEYFSIIGDGKKAHTAERTVKALKSQLIDIQQAYLLSVDCPRPLSGLSNALARLLSQLVDAADGFHSFSGNPLDENYGFHYLKLGWKRMEVFEAEYAIIREVLRDLLDPITYRKNFENIENIGI